jgi:hypothetical protein
MPNWCAGTLKVRGKIEDLKKFVLEGLQPVGFLGDDKPALELDHLGNCSYKGICWIENTNRGFVDNPEIYFCDYEREDEPQVICLDASFAWAIDAEQLQKTCIKYNVDMKIYAFEGGMEFNQDIEIVNGEVLCDKEITFKDKDYLWECICPTMGG